MIFKNKKVLSHLLLGILTIFVVIPFLALAQPGGGASTGTVGGGASTGTGGAPVTGPIQIENPFNCGPNCTLPDFIKKVLNDIVLPIGGVISVLMIVYSGFLFVTAQGNESKITKAKDALLYACIGAAILLGAIVISQAIGGTINQLKA